MDEIQKGRFYILGLGNSKAGSRFWAFIKDMSKDRLYYFYHNDNVWEESVAMYFSFAVEVENIEIIPLHAFSKEQKRTVVKSIL